ncbi:hypothetical protein HDV05_001362 [Chytridiales sp. JEL 0842]|nr:hypothetical protein HDV05_001362 [Chytridiales sp. JEL 0842]
MALKPGKKGIIALNNVPQTLQAGEKLKGWMDIRCGATCTAEEPVMLEMIGFARSSWVVRPDSPYATDVDRLNNKVRRVSNENVFWTMPVKMAEAQDFAKGDHSFTINVQAPKTLFPTYLYSNKETGEEMEVRYVIRVKFINRDNPIDTVEKPIKVTAAPLDQSALTPFEYKQAGPSGASVELRSCRTEWQAGSIVTCGYKVRAPPKAQVGAVFLELHQRASYPSPYGPSELIATEGVVATFLLPGCGAGKSAEFKLKLDLPNVASGMRFGPIDVSYQLRSVVAFPPPVPNTPAITEMLPMEPVSIVPDIQTLNLPPNFDDTIEGLDPDAPTVKISPQPLAPRPPPQPVPVPFQGPPPGPGFIPPGAPQAAWGPGPGGPPNGFPPQGPGYPPFPGQASFPPGPQPGGFPPQGPYPPGPPGAQPPFIPGAGPPPAGFQPVPGGPPIGPPNGLFQNSPPGQPANGAWLGQNAPVSPTPPGPPGPPANGGWVGPNGPVSPPPGPPPAKPGPPPGPPPGAPPGKAPGDRANSEEALALHSVGKSNQEEEDNALKSETAETLRRIQEERALLEEQRKKRLEDEQELLRLKERQRLEAEEAKKIREELEKLEQLRKEEEEAARLRREVEEKKKQLEDEKLRLEQEKRQAELLALELKKRAEEEEQRRRMEGDELARRRVMQEEALRKIKEQKEALELDRQLKEAQMELDRLRTEESIRLAKAEAEKERIKLEAEIKLAKEKAELLKIQQELERVKLNSTRSAAPPPQPPAQHQFGNIASNASGSSSSSSSRTPGAPPQDNSLRNAPRFADTVAKAVAQAPSAGGPSGSAPLPPVPRSVSEDAIKRAYMDSLDGYRDKLLRHFTAYGTFMPAKDREQARNDVLQKTRGLIESSPNGRKTMDALLSEMRSVENELAEAYETSAFTTLTNRMNEVKYHLSESVTAGVITTSTELNAECSTVLEYIMAKTDPNLPRHVKEKAQKYFEDNIRSQLLRRVQDSSKKTDAPKPPQSPPSQSSSSAYKQPPGAPPPARPTGPVAYAPPQTAFRQTPGQPPVGAHPPPPQQYQQFAPPTSPPPPQHHQHPGQPYMYTQSKDPRLCVRGGCNKMKASGSAFCSRDCERTHGMQQQEAYRKR